MFCFRCIVTQLSKQCSPRIVESVKSFLYFLYEKVVRRQSYCRFFVMPKEINSGNYRVVISVVDDDCVNTEIGKWVRAGYTNDPSQVSSVFLCSHNSSYNAILSSEEIDIRGIRTLRLEYLYRRPTHQHSLVHSRSPTAFLCCEISKASCGATPVDRLVVC